MVLAPKEKEELDKRFDDVRVKLFYANKKIEEKNEKLLEKIDSFIGVFNEKFKELSEELETRLRRSRVFLGPGISNYLDLPDTPGSYSGQENKVTRVNAAESALEFVDINPTNFPAIPNTFLKLTDTPASYSGKAGWYPRVNALENALVFDFIDLSVFVPYVGATADVDLGVHNLTVGGAGIFGSLVVNTNTLIVNATNNRVGIGTATPTHTVQIVSPDFEVILFKRDTGGAGGGGSMIFENDAGDKWGFGCGSDATMTISDRKTKNNVLRIEPGAPSDSIRINNDGKVGILIGTAKPSDELDLRTGTIRVGRYRIGPGRLSYAYWNPEPPALPAGEIGALELGFAGTYLSYAFPTRICADRNAYLEVFGDDTVAPTFNFIGGNVGINTTIPATKLQVVGDARFGDQATNYLEVKNDGEVNLHGTARVERHWLIDPTRFKMPAANYPGHSFEGLYYTLDFDRLTEESTYCIEHIPYRWDVGTDIEVEIDWFHDTADAGAVVWGIEYKAIKDGETVAGAGTIITQASAGNHTEGVLVRTTFTTKILHTNLETHDIMACRLFRKSADGSDTLDEDARVINICFHFIQNKLGKTT